MTSKKPKLIARSTRFFHPQYAPSFFTQQNSDAAASKAQGQAQGADGKAPAKAEAFPFYQTTSGNAFGYNFRARQQQADANYIRAPMPGHQICDTELATAPLFRRGADGVRQLYGDEQMDAKKSQFVHPPVRPHVPASEPDASHARRKFARTYAFGATQTPTQALAHAQAQLSFTAGDGTTVVSAAASAAAAHDGAGGATTAALRGKGHATTFLPPLPKTPPKEVQALVAPDKLWVSPNSLK